MRIHSVFDALAKIKELSSLNQYLEGNIQRPCNMGILATVEQPQGRWRYSYCFCTPAPSRGDWSIMKHCNKRIRPKMSSKPNRNDDENNVKRPGLMRRKQEYHHSR
ncbi:hypothetical protein HN011_000892 [Eciton burchellii]|nr:hypothetical protein HN011_000892 [Eciton burchellii]